MFQDLWILTLRELRRWTRTPFTFITLFAGPAIWIFVFGTALNQAFFSQGSQGAALQGAPNYFNFMATGILASAPISFSARTGGSLFMDRFTGYLDRLLVSPAARETILFSKILGGALLTLAQVGALLVLTLPFGLVTQNLSILSVLIAAGSVVLLTCGFASIFLLFSMRIRRWTTQQLLIPLIVTPLTFVSNVFYPITRLPPVIRGFAVLNPLSYTINITRGVFFQDSQFLTGGLLPNLAVLLGFTLVSTAALLVISKKWL